MTAGGEGRPARVDTVLLHRNTRRELRERIAGGEVTGCLIPVGAVEQHLEHLAVEHDWRSVTEVARAVAQRLAPRVLVAEGLMVGVSEHHLKHPGTLSLRPATFVAVLTDLVRSVVRAGIENVVVLNGHGGNVAPVHGAWEQLLREFQVNLHFLSYWEVLTVEDAKELLRGRQRLPEDLPGHAQEFETSLALARFPGNVRRAAVDDQADGSPALATAAQGEAFFERTVERVTAFVASVVAGERQAEVPRFFD